MIVTPLFSHQNSGELSGEKRTLNLSVYFDIPLVITNIPVEDMPSKRA